MTTALLSFVSNHLSEVDKMRCTEAWELRQPIPYDCEDNIISLCDEFTDDNNLPAMWYFDIFDDARDIFIHL